MATEAQDRAEAERQSWQFRAVLATRGNQTLMGTVVLAVIGRNAKNPPWIEEPFTILADGTVITDVVTRDRWLHKNQPLFHVSDLVSEFRRLADHLRLSDDDRIAMFAELRKFIKLDMRADHDELKHHS